MKWQRITTPEGEMSIRREDKNVAMLFFKGDEETLTAIGDELSRPPITGLCKFVEKDVLGCAIVPGVAPKESKTLEEAVDRALDVLGIKYR